MLGLKKAEKHLIKWFVIKGSVMKKLVSIVALSVLTACTAPQEASTIGNGAAAYDMNTVQDYNARVTSGNTVSAQEKAKVAQRDSIPNEMNASDHRYKQRGYSRVPVAIMPSVGVGYCRHCW
jgi:uncharacterized lipoprotein YajG